MEGFFRKLEHNADDIAYIPPAADALQNQAIPNAIKEIIERGQNIRTIFVPINHHNRHWTLLVINLANRSYFHYDPMVGSGELNRPILEMVRSAEAIIGKKLRKIEDITLRANRQESDWECGYYCLLAAFFHAFQIPVPRFDINQSNNLRSFLARMVDGINEQFVPFGASMPSSWTVWGSSGKPLGSLNDSTNVDSLVKVILII